jgi:hypothetical protein
MMGEKKKNRKRCRFFQVSLRGGEKFTSVPVYESFLAFW